MHYWLNFYKKKKKNKKKNKKKQDIKYHSDDDLSDAPAYRTRRNRTPSNNIITNNDLSLDNYHSSEDDDFVPFCKYADGCYDYTEVHRHRYRH